MAIQNELDLDNKYQTSIDSELQKTTIKQPTVSALNKYTSAIKPTSVGSLGFESGNVVPLPKPTITAPELKPIQYTPEQQALVNSDMYKNIKAIAETQTATDLNTLSDNLNYIGDFASTLDDRVVSGLKSGVIGMPIQLAKLQEMSRSLAFNTVGLKSVISDEEFFATTNKFKEAGLKILQKDSSYIAQLNQDLQNKYADKNVFGATKFASEVAGTMVDMIPVIATNAVFGGGGMAVLYATASSRSIGEALNLGLNEDESITYGALMGGLEVATELMFNGIPMMETSKYGKWLTSKLDDQIASVIKSVSKNKVSQNVIKLLSNSIGEGFEEVVSEIVGFGIRAYYEVEDRISDKGLFSLETASNLAQDAFSSFLLGAISSIGMNVVHAQAMKVMESVANTSVIQNLNPAESTRLAEKIANNVLGYNYEQISLEEAVEKYGNVKIEERTGGFIDPNTNTIVVIDDGSGINPLTRTVFHEVAHALEITGEYKNLIAEVQSHMGEDYAQDVLKYVIDAGLLENNKEIIRSGLHSWDSEYIAEIIIQRSLFGESSGMRTSFVRKLANENPKLLERISDAVNNLKKKMIATQAKFDDDNIYPAQLAYVENLQRMFETAFRQYKETDEYLLKTQAKILGKEYETQETQQQKIIKSIDTLNPNEIIQTDNETVNDLYVMNRMIGTSIKENIAKIEATFNLNQFDMSNLFNLLYNMDEESANDNHMLMGAINSRFGKKLSYWFKDITELKNYQLSELLVFARNVHTYFDNAKEIDTYGFNEVSIKSLSDIFEEGVTDENKSSKIYESLQLIQDSINLKGVKYIGFGTKLDKELVVLHNITEDKLKSAFKLGGFASPSLAVTKADIPHGNFGDITIIFNKDILNGSPTYTSDGYTPRFPRVFLGMTSDADIKAFKEDIEKYRGLDGFDYLTNFVYNNQNAMFLDNDRTISRLLDTDAGRAIANDISGLNDDLKIEEEAMRYRMMLRSGEITQQELDDYKVFSDGVGEARFKFIETFFKKYAQEYFRNNIETFTPSGNRKHPKYLLNEVTLENVVKYMKSHGDMIGKEYASISSLKEVKAMLSPTMKSVKDVIANKKLIGKLNSFDAIIDDAEQVLSFIGQQMSDRAGEEDILKGYMAGSVIDEIVDSRNITVENISRRFKNKGFYFVDEVYDDVEGIIVDEELKDYTYAELINKYLTDVRDLTVTYFESKPRRAVEFSEIQKILLPDYIEQSIIDTVEELGIPYEIYEFMPNNSNADGRLELIENDKSIQFQFINNAKTDSEGIKLTPEQQTYFFNTKVLDDNKNLLRVRKDGILGYMNIQNLFDTTDRLNLTAIDAYNYESYKTITLDENGYLNESDAESLLSYLNINGYNFDGINFAVNGQVSYLPATNNQFKPLNDLNPVDVQEVQYQFKKVLETFDNVRGIEDLVQDLTFSNMKSWMDFGSKKEALDELQRYKDNVRYNNGSEKTLKYFDLIEDFIRTYDKNDNHDSDGNLITLAQLDLLKDVYSTKNNVPQVYYHGTDYDFDTFSFENIGETGIQDGLGFYFTQNARFAFKYSGESKQKLKEVYLNIKNPVGFGDYLTEEVYKNYVNKIYELFNSMLSDYSRFTDAMMFDELFVRMGKSSIESAMKSIKESFIDNIYEYAVSSKGIVALRTKTSLDNFVLNNIKGIKYAGKLSTEIFLKRNINDFMRSVQQAYIDSTGFDGLESNTAIVAFLPEQVKDIDNKNPQDTPYLIEQPEVQMQISDEIAEKIKDDIYINVIDLELNDLKNSYDTYLLLESSNAQEAYNNDIYDYSSFVDDYVEEMKVDLNKAIEELWYQFREDSMYYLKNDYDEYLEKDLLKEEHSKLLVYVYNLIETLPTPNNINRSNKSISTYLTYDSSKYDEVLNALQKNSYEINTLKEDLKDTFEVRISDHYGGTYRDLMTGQLEKYQEGDISIILSKSANIQMQILDKSSTGEKLTDGQKSFFENIAPIMINDNGEMKTVYHGTNHIFTVPLQDKSNGFYRFGEHNVMFLALDPEVSLTYAKGEMKIIDFKSEKPSGNIMKGYARIEKPLVIDAGGTWWNDINEYMIKIEDNNYSNASISNFNEIKKNIISIDFNKLENFFNKALDFQKKYINYYNEIFENILKTDASFNEYQKNDLNNILDVLNNKFNNFNKIIKDILESKKIISYENIEEYTRLFNNVAFGGYDIMTMLEAYFSGNVYHAGYKTSDFQDINIKIKTLRYMSNNMQLDFGYDFDDFLKKIKNMDKLSTNFIVSKVLELIDKGLVDTDAVYFKNIKDFGGKNKLPSNIYGQDVIALIGESKFKDYQNENPTLDVNIQLQSRIPTTKYMEYQMNKIKELQKSENIYIARMNITQENYNDNYEFLEYVKKIEDKQNIILTENDKKKIISQFKYQDDDIYKDHREYAKHSTNLYEERQKRKFIDAIVANIPYSRLRTTDNTSSVYLDVPVEFYDEIINRFGNKTIVPVNPRNLTSSTFTMRISDHDKLSENHSIPDVAIDVRDFGYVPLSMQENIKDSEEKDSNGNAISIGQALRFSKSRARDSKGNLIRYYLSIPLRDGQIVKAGSMLTTDRATSLKYIQTQYDFDMFERYGIEPTVYEVYLDRRNTFDTRGGYDMKVYNDLFMSKSSKHLELTKSGLPNVTMKEQLKKFLIDEGYDYDSFVVRDGEQDVIVTLMDGMAKGVDNKNPTYMPSRTQPEGMAVQHQSIYAPALTEEEKRELNNLKFLDSTAGILPMDAHYVGYNELLEKENKLVLYGGLLKLLKFKNWQGSDFSKEYAKIKRKFEKGGIYEHDLFKGYLQAVKGKTIKGVTKRTMSEWLYIARNFGMDYKATSEQDMLEQAIYAWLSLKPNTKDNLNRQGEKFVDFKVAKWVEEILKGATAGTMIDASEVTETVIPQIDELLEPEEVLKETPENYEEDAVLYEYVDESLIPPEMEEYFEPSLEDMNDFYTMMYVKDLLTKPVVDESKPIGTRKFPKTVLTSGNVSESLAGEVEVMLENGSFNYVIISDKEAMQRASEALVTKEDLLQAKTALYDKYINGQVLNKFDIARAELMMTRFSEFDVDSSRDILIILASAGTQYGQAIQALSLIKRMSASGQLKALEMIVKRMNSEYKDANRKYKGKNIEIKIKDEHIKELLQQIDKEDIENTVEKIKQDIADQIPATWYDKMNAWRYLSMLGNFKTHERNFLGNISMLPLRFFRDVFSETMQGVLPEEQRVKSIKSLFDAELFAFASDDFKNIESVSSSKYDTRNDIEKMRRIFDTNILHKSSELNFKALEWEDVIFRKRHYIMSLVQYMGAKGLKPETITNDELIKARTFANEESKKMVFQQASKVANLINQFKRQHYVAGIAVDAIQPFVLTPINIAKTEAEYSPIGLLSGIVNMIVDIKNGEPTTKSLDKLSAGLTGSMFSLIGAMMYAMGFLNVGDDDDEQYKETLFKKMFGYQRYSLNILGGTYSLDWLTPVIVPLIIGGELYKYFEERTEYNFFDIVTEETLRAFDPLLEMSMMSGIMNIMKSYKESPSASLAEIGSTMLGNFISQFVPTLSSQTAQTVYSGVSSTYAPSDSWSTVLEKSLRKVANKIPYVSSYINAPMIDIWGNPIEQADNLLARGLSNFLSVGYYKPDVSTKIDDEILRLYELTKNSDVIPDTVPKDFVNAGVKYIFDNQEYSDFSQNYGQTQYKLIGNMLESSDYYRLSSDEKASLADSLYKYAYADSKSKYLKSNGLTYDDGWYKGIEEAKQAGIDPVEYLLLKQVYNTMKSDSILTKKERFINYLENTGRSLSMNKYLQYIGGYTVESDLLRNLK